MVGQAATETVGETEPDTAVESPAVRRIVAVVAEIGDVRGLGAMIAMEFVKNGDPRQPGLYT